jgi:hypothetical protein
MKTGLKLLTANKASFFTKILNSTHCVNFTEVAEAVIRSFNAGAKKVVLPVRTQEVNTDLTFICNEGKVQIESDCRAIRNCAPDYDWLHEFYYRNFAEAFYKTEITQIEFIKVVEPLGDLTVCE